MIYAFDVETYLITPGNPAPKLVCVSFACAREEGVLLREEGLDWLEERLDAEDHLIAHNARFDLSVCAAERPRLLIKIFQAYLEGRIHDTGIRQKILDNARGELKYVFNEETGEYKAQKYSLAHLCHRILGKWRFNDKEGDVWRLRYYTLDGVPVEKWPESAVKYALEDSTDALAIFFEQEKDKHSDLLEMEWSQTQPDWALQLMSIWGSRTNEEEIEILEAELQEKYDEWVEACKEYNLVRRKKEKGEYKWARTMVNIYALVEETYKKHGLEVPLTDKGKVSTSRDTLLMREYPGIEPHPGMKAVAEMVRVGKLLTTYIPMLKLGSMVPINPNYNCILETFRTSCSKPNIQNLPRDGGVRNCWHARPGYVYGFCDYDTLEMRTLAQICIILFGYSKIADAIKEGKDLHLAFAAALLGISYEDAQERLKREDKLIVETRQGCFHPDTEILTSIGWKLVADLTLEDEVAAAIPENDGIRIEWQKPTELTRRTLNTEGTTPYDKLYHLKTEGIDIRVTGNHRMLAYRQDGGWEECSVTELAKKRGWYNTGKTPGGSWDPEEQLLRLAVATQADGSYRKKQIAFGFYKQRKIDRMRDLLKGIPHRESVHTNGSNPNVTVFTVYGDSDYPSGNKTPKGPARQIREILSNKHFDSRWLNLSSRARRIVLDEAQHWDATCRGRSTSYTYFSMEKDNAEILQIIATQEGIKTSLVQSKSSGLWKLTIRRNPLRKCDRSRGDNLKVVEVPYEGDVVCLSVPSTFVLVRDGGIPVVTGNSKISNYGMSGGMGPHAFIEYARGFNVEITLERAIELHQGFRRMWPEMVEYFEYCSNVAEDKDPETGINQVEFFVSGLLRGDVGYTQICNGYFQNLAAMGAKRALFEVALRCYTNKSSALYGCRPWLFAHDEIGLEIPFDGTEEGRVKASRAMTELKQVMKESMERFVPDVPIGATGAMSFTWLKGAKPVFRVINGEKTLVPCKKEGKEWIEDYSRDTEGKVAA